jgi:hypothetical protein
MICRTKGAMKTKRRSGLPPTLAGRVFRYDRKTTVIPIEISPRSPHWDDVPEAQHHTRNYFLRFLPTSVRGKTIFAHDQLAELLKGKKEKGSAPD